MRSFLALESVPLGYDPNNLMLLDIVLSPKRYPKPEQRNNLFTQLVPKLQALPGVLAVSAGNGGYPWGGPLSAFTVPGKNATPDKRVHVAFVSDGYLKAMRVPLVRGRMISEQEVMRADHVGVINQTGAADLWPNENPVGKQIALDLLKNPPPFLAAARSDAPVTIVGVIGDVKNEGLRETIKPGILLPYTLTATPARTIAVRSDTDPRRLTNAIRDAVRSLDNDLPVARFITAGESLDFETVGPRFTMMLFAVFAVIGLTLAAIGIYSVLSYTVSQRTNELGIRMALGAERRDVLSLVLRSGLGLVLVGLAVGLLASLFMTRLIQAQLFGITGRDPVAYIFVSVLLAIIGAIACYVPARRASELDPAVALRNE
jgi:putative ABC transport system permease protein